MKSASPSLSGKPYGKRPYEYGSPYRGLEKEVRGAAADLAALKFEVLQKVGEAVGDTQTYQL